MDILMPVRKPYFIETQIYSGGVEQPPRKTPIALIGDSLSFNLDELNDEDDVSVLSEEGNWYTIKKRDILFEDTL